MNRSQKNVLATGIIFIIVTFIYWYTQGAQVFTKTQVLVDKTTELDKMLGVKNEQWIDQFVFGLFPSGTASIWEMISTASIAGVIVVVTGILFYLFKNKRKES